MDTFTATMIAEGVEEAESEEQAIEAWQTLIDTGLAWQLQGSFGRTAQRLIDMEICHLPGTEKGQAVYRIIRERDGRIMSGVFYWIQTEGEAETLRARFQHNNPRERFIIKEQTGAQGDQLEGKREA